MDNIEIAYQIEFRSKLLCRFEHEISERLEKDFHEIPII